jgi:hypothetical protein
MPCRLRASRWLLADPQTHRQPARRTPPVADLVLVRHHSKSSRQMKIHLLLIALICLCYRCALACIGETEAQIAGRYGSPTAVKDGYAPNHKLQLYEFSGYTILVHFIGGKSQSEAFQKARREEMSPTEIATLLKANAISGEWEPTWSNDRFSEFRLGDRLYAGCEPGIGYLVIETFVFKEWVKKAKTASERQSLGGF